MFIEVKGKPKTVIIQKRTKANKWSDIGTVTLREGIDYNAARNILSACPNFLSIDYRLIIRGKKSQKEYQVLSSRSDDLYDIFEQMERDKSIYLLIDGGKQMIANNSNPHCCSMETFIHYVRSKGGIVKASQRAFSDEDGGLQTFDVTYMNDDHESISVFHS